MLETVVTKIIRKDGCKVFKSGNLRGVSKGEYDSRVSFFKVMDMDSCDGNYEVSFVDSLLGQDGLSIKVYSAEKAIDFQFWLSGRKINYSCKKRFLWDDYKFKVSQKAIEDYFSK
ncbi:MAG: hypothetical protein ABIB71_05785 [Candidatus Woesearchaeota archaeon]